jgi:hypothetical protein
MKKLITIRVADYERHMIGTALNSINMPLLADKIRNQDAADDGPEVEILREKENGQ